MSRLHYLEVIQHLYRFSTHEDKIKTEYVHSSILSFEDFMSTKNDLKTEEGEDK